MKVLGITGWSGCGKTTLIVALIPRLRALGLTVSTLKHAHHDVDLDRPGKDTFRHREAGAPRGYSGHWPTLGLVARVARRTGTVCFRTSQYLQPVDLVLVEGWKTGHIPSWKSGGLSPAASRRCFQTITRIIAVASDPPLDPAQHGRPDLLVLPLTDLDGIASFILRFVRAAESHL